MKVAIAGAGIGGLTAALCCLRRGHDVVVLEKTSVMEPVGAGIQISPNAVKVLRALGVENAIAQNAFEPQRIEARMGRSGRSIFTIPLAETAIERWGAPYYHIHRADYIGALLDCVKQSGGEIRLGCEVKDYSQNGRGVTLTLGDSSKIVADVLIGADGIHSRIREIMPKNQQSAQNDQGAQSAEFTGNVAWRAVVPMSALGDLAPPPTACIWMGPGRHCVTYRLRGGTLANLVAVVERDDWTGESWTEKGSRAEALADFTGWHPTIGAILENAGALYRWALFDRQPLEKWTDGRVALLGDAAHPMLPFLAQGAAMAVEDGWVLADKLAASDDPQQALLSYQNARKTRTAKTQRGSRANAANFHKHTRFGQMTSYGLMWLGGKFAPELIHRRQDWLYGFDVTGG